MKNTPTTVTVSLINIAPLTVTGWKCSQKNGYNPATFDDPASFKVGTPDVDYICTATLSDKTTKDCTFHTYGGIRFPVIKPGPVIPPIKPGPIKPGPKSPITL